ncbi:helix-turn-helix domain-containing protein [Achromobacter kerstersii]|uniref:helix-turn-helix domain-containing protein n=1 Tax=Achromobacter kerstersii TaxID=1353890 RepID=UPI001581B804|nr:helix-turn-helix domain-containing protein [Achromobacter kerstersii]
MSIIDVDNNIEFFKNIRPLLTAVREAITLIDNLIREFDETCELNGIRTDNDWAVDLNRSRLRCPHGGFVSLTFGELLIADALIRRAEDVVSYDELTRALENGGAHKSKKELGKPSIRVLVSRLKTKINRAYGVFPVQPVRGVGYIFTPE